MATVDYHSHPYVQQLNAWHSEFAMLRDLIHHLLSQADGPDWLTSSAHIAQSRFLQLVETFPFPDASDLDPK